MDNVTKFLIILLIFTSATVPVYGQGDGATVKGKVTDQAGAAIPGVTVVVKGTTTGTVTDIEGNYSFNLSEDAEILVFSFVGMASEEVLIGNQNQINVTLSEDAADLDEVIVV